jgi:large subunit ribosomal protein L19
MNCLQRILEIQKKQTKHNLPYYAVGDTVCLRLTIQEGIKQRIQVYQGVLIAKKTNGVNSTLLIRRVFQSISIERVFLVHSPLIRSIQILRSTKVRRAKLYYLRELKGKAARLRERTK